MAQVILDNVTKVYGGRVVAVDGMSLRIPDGQFMVLVGPSGCGKTTTLRMIAGLEELTAGRIHIGQRIVNDVAPKDRDIAMVFQNYALYPHMTVYRNMAFALKLRKYPRRRIERRVRAAAEMLGIEKLLDRKPAALSGGQMQRVALGRAIVRHPRVFLFDEPLSNLDARLRVEMRAELKRLHRELKVTTIYVTHDQEEAMTLGDRIAVMAEGVVQQCGTPLEVYGSPVNRFVGAFIGSPAMNFLTGRLSREGEDLFFEEGEARIGLPRQWTAALRQRVGAEVVLGVRPTAMSLHAGAATAGARAVLPVRVDVIEQLGDKMDLYVSTGPHPHIVARVDAEASVEAGRQIQLRLDMHRAFIFEPGEMGANLTSGLPGPPA